MQSNGNDFLITEDKNILNLDPKKLSDRKTGIGFDQLLLLRDLKISGKLEYLMQTDQKQELF